MDDTLGLAVPGESQLVGVDLTATRPESGEPIGVSAGRAAGSPPAETSRRWRTVWRVHFYAGVFALPMLVLLSITGLVILYTEPINNAFGADLRKVVPAGAPVTLDAQREAVETAFPDLHVSGVTTPKSADLSTVFAVTSDDEHFRDVYVNPYTGVVLGSLQQGSGIVGLANRLHGTLNNDSLKVPLPMLTGILGDGPAFASVPVGEMAVEIWACWGLVLAGTGIFLWWPRKAGTGKAMFLPSLARFRKGGRARWRDLHAVPGILFAGVLMFFVSTGLPWSSYWGDNWSAASSDITPAPRFDEPASTLARTGDLDRFGNRIEWSVRNVPVPASDPTAGSDASGGLGHPAHPEHGPAGTPTASTAAEPATVVEAGLPAPLSLDRVAEIAWVERMQPGYSIALPVDSPTTLSARCTAATCSATRGRPGWTPTPRSTSTSSAASPWPARTPSTAAPSAQRHRSGSTPTWVPSSASSTASS